MDLSERICGDAGMGGQDMCLFETRTAFDCLLRRKVQQQGDLTDNVGLCSQHINNMKMALGETNHSMLNGHIERLNLSRVSFV
jgi:hypothetical protein